MRMPARSNLLALAMMLAGKRCCSAGLKTAGGATKLSELLLIRCNPTIRLRDHTNRIGADVVVHRGIHEDRRAGVEAHGQVRGVRDIDAWEVRPDRVLLLR